MDTVHSHVRILLADDRTILRTGLRNLLEKESDLRVVGEAVSGEEAIRLAEALKPDVAIISAQLPDPPALDVVRRLAAQKPNIRTLLTITIGDEDLIMEAFHHGVRGVVMKASPTRVLIQGIRSVMEGKIWLGNRSVTRLGKKLPKLDELSGAETPQKTYGLTWREMQIVSAIVSGYSNKEMAKKFSLSEDTVKHHLTNVFDKAGVYNRLELALFAIHHGLVGRR